MDRWSLSITQIPPSASASSRSKGFVRGFSSKPSATSSPKSIVKVCNNYLSVGADARIALDFHRARLSQPQLFRSRLVNKAWYALLGCRQIALNVLTYVGITFQLELEKEAKTPDSPQNIKLIGATLQLDSLPTVELDHLRCL